MLHLILAIIVLWLVCCTFYLIYNIVNLIRKAILSVAGALDLPIYDKEKDNRFQNPNHGFSI